MLGHYADDQMFCTAVLRLIRQHTEQMQPALSLYFPSLLKILAWYGGDLK